MQLTSKQYALMQTITTLNEDGSFLDIDQIVERAPYKPSKQSLQFSIRALIKHKLIEKKPQENRRGRMRNVIAPTVLGDSVMGKTSKPAFVVDLDHDILEEVLSA